MTPKVINPPRVAVLAASAVFFLSGSSALILEIVWTRQLELLLGNTVQAASTMIAVYMLGLGLGARWGASLCPRLRSPLKTYAAIELMIVAWALAVPFFLRTLDALFPLLNAVPLLHDPDGTPAALRLLASFLIFMLPTLLMGATLPILTQAVAPEAKSLAARFSLLYGSNTLGAAIGVLLAGFLLIPDYGIWKSALFALALNVTAALAALALSLTKPFQAQPGPVAPEASERADRCIASTSGSSLTLALALAAGFLSLYLEIFWFRTLVLVFGSTTYSLSAMLAIFLCAAALGPLVLGWLADRGRSEARIPTMISLCFLFAGAVVIVSLSLIGNLPERFLRELAASEFSWRQLLRSKFITSAEVIFVPVFFLGSILPLCVKGVREGAAGLASAPAVARVYLANTIGAAGGVLVGGFLILPAAGLHHGMLAAGAACLLAASLVMLVSGPAGSRLRVAVPSLACFIALIWWAFHEPWDKKKFALGAYFQPGSHSSSQDLRFDEVLETSDLLVYEEGVASTVAVLRGHENSLHYMSNGKVEADTGPRGMINQRLLGHLSMLLHPGEPRRVLNIGLGAGVTLGAMGCHPGIEALHTVEIEPAALLAADAFAAWNQNILKHPRLRIHFNDARNFLLTSGQEYDVICSDPFEPVVAGVIHLFTREHFELARSRLAGGGILCQWIPMYEMSLEDYTALVATFTAVFPQTLYFSTGADSILVGFKSGMRVDPEALAERLQNPQVAASLAAIGFTKPEHLWSLLITDFSTHPMPAPPQLNTDDHPFVAYTAPRNALRKTHLENRRLQLDLFRSQRESGTDSTFMSALDGEPAEAIARQQDALQLSLESGYHLAGGDLQKALETARKSVVLAPANPIVRDEAASIYSIAAASLLQTGESGAALDLIQQAYRLQPGEFKNLYRLALTQLQRGDMQEAGALLVRGIKQFPNSPYFYSLHATWSLQSGKVDEALAFAKLATEKAPGLPRLWDQYEQIARSSGDREILADIQKKRLAAVE